MMLNYMTYSVSALVSDQKENELKNFTEIVNKASLTFNSIPTISFPTLKVPQNIEDVKSIFR